MPAGEWMRCLARGELQIRVLAPGRGSYGGRHGAWGFAARRIASHIVYAVSRGGIRARWAKGETILKPGSMLWLSPQARHDFSLHPDGRPISLFHCRVDVTDRHGRRCRVEDDALVLHDADGLARSLEEALLQGESGFERARTQGIFLVLCAALMEPRARGGSGRRLTPLQRRAIEKRVAEATGRFLTATELANEVDLSPEYFARLFVNSYGMKPRTWIVRQRIRQAAALLVESPAPVKDVAARFGYAEPYFFSRQFFRIMGCGPSKYRRSQATPDG